MAKIGVDIGHGRNTFPPSKGVYKNGIAYHEHDANSRVAKRLTELLEAAGHTVYQAQKAGHVDVPLSTRTSLYLAQGVDLIVSAHANAGVPSGNGYASFYWHNDSKAKRLSDLYAQEIKAQGFRLWGAGSRPSKPNDWSNFHMCRVPSRYNIPSILLENGFMTNSGDFEWIFGSKRDEYAERCAVAAFKAIQRYLGESTEIKGGSAVKHVSKPVTKHVSTKSNKSIAQMAQEVIAGQHGSGHTNRRNSLGISQAEYEKVRAEVNRLASGGSVSKPAPKPKKSIAQMADEVVAGKHGSGHDNRRKSLGISQAEYDKVRAEVNRRAGVKSAPKAAPKKSVSQMAQEVIAGKHGSGHANRRKSLGISQAEYDKVRAEVNRIASGGKASKPKKSISQMATEVIAGKHGSGHEARRKSLGISKAEYEKVRAEVNRRL